MLKLIFFILTFFVLTNVFGQSLDNDSIKIICRDCFKGERSYYLNARKIDIDKVFFKLENVKSIELLSYETASKLLGDTTKAGVVLITPKSSLSLLTLKDFLFKNNLDTSIIYNDDIIINDKQIIDTSVLIDSKARVVPIFSRSVCAGKEGKICGVFIYTKEE